MTKTPQTQADAYRAVIDAGEDVALRKRVAASLGMESRTTHELAQAFPEHSQNALRPRVNELLRMGCVRREGTRENPSGHDAYIHHLTDTGEAYVRGEVDPDPETPLAELQASVVKAARDFVNGDLERDLLEIVIERHDKVKERRNPEWSP